MIPLIDLGAQQARIRDKIDAGISRVLDHGMYIMGPEITAIETRLAAAADSRHCISCASGTDALMLALLAKGLKPGEGVIVPSFTFAASAEVMPALGAMPVFAEVDATSFNLDPAGLPAALSAARAAGITVVGIIGVGLFGQPADYESINSFAAAEGLWVIDDAAQSFGASWQGNKVGTLASITCTSFFPAKPLGCYGDGGAVFTNDDTEADIMRSCRIHGMGKARYEYERIGMTARLDAMQAVILDAKLDIFDEELVMRQQVADRYAARLADSVGVPVLADGATSSWAQYTIKLRPGTDREMVMETLREHGVPSAVYYPIPTHRQPPYSRYPVSDDGLQVTAALCEQVLSLPMHPYLDAATQDQIAVALAASLEKATAG